MSSWRFTDERYYRNFLFSQTWKKVRTARTAAKQNDSIDDLFEIH